MNPVKTIPYKHCTINIYQDDDAPNPRTEHDNVGIMLCKHRDYILGDRERGEPEPTAEEIIAITERDDVLWLPLYLYDHSGITIKAGSPSAEWIDRRGRFVGDDAGWDTSTVGIIYCTKAKAIEEWGKTRYTKAVERKAIACLQGEVKEYASYLEGDVCGYVAEDPDGEQIDACWGFFPDDREGYAKQWDYMIGEAKHAIDYHVQTRTERANEYAQLG